MEAKTIKILYWVITGLFILFTLFGAFGELTQNESAKQLLGLLGYPVYVNYLLGIAKVLGLIALVQWRFKALKEWAYAGFTFDILLAAGSAYFVEGLFSGLFTAVFLIPVLLSYWLWKKMPAS